MASNQFTADDSGAGAVLVLLDVPQELPTLDTLMPPVNIPVPVLTECG